MRASLWLLGLFAVAVVSALFAASNGATVTLYWSPYRVDLSLNLVLLMLVMAFVLIYAAMRSAALLFALPAQAKRWRALQKERAINAELLNSYSHFLAGRYLRAKKSALTALNLDKTRELPHPNTDELTGNEVQLRALAHLVAAQSAHALQDTAAREEHLQSALRQTNRGSIQAREGAQMLAAHWALDDRNAAGALDWLAQLPVGAARRTLALRLKLRAAQLDNLSEQALDTTRLLAKHHAFSPDIAASMVRSLVLKRLDAAHDAQQLLAVWRALEPSDKKHAAVAIHAAYRYYKLQGEMAVVSEWLLPAWQMLTSANHSLPNHNLDMVDSKSNFELIETVAACCATLDLAWLSHVEKAHLANPRDPRLQYLAGMACRSHQLWGKAQQHLTQAAATLQDADLKRQAWLALADIYEQRGDQSAAVSAWKKAAQV
jgi:HemY protein